MIRLHDFPDNAPRCYFCGVRKGDAEAHPETITCIARPEPRADGGRKVSALDDVDALRERIAAIKAEAGETATCLTVTLPPTIEIEVGTRCTVLSEEMTREWFTVRRTDVCFVEGQRGTFADAIGRIYFIARKPSETRAEFEARRLVENF